MIGRRDLLKSTVGAVAGSLIMPRLGRPAQSAASRLSEKISVIPAGTNVVTLSGSDGLVVVDSGTPLSGPVLTAHFNELAGGGRVHTVFNTHWHLENTGSNEGLGQAGARIVAHENTRLWMATPYWVPAEERYQEPRPAAARPTETFYTTGSMEANGERIDYGYLIAAHTSGDIFVFFRDSNVLAVGDVAAPARDPELDYFTGAWLGGRLDALTRLVELSDEATRIVPGYGPVMTRTGLEAERDTVATIYERVVDQAREGASARDMLEAGVLDGLARTWDAPMKFLDDVYKGLWAHHNKLAPNVV